jgi:RNA recognition motif-containing protein
MAQKLYVGNLAFSATEDSVRELFAQYGEVHSVTLITDRETGRPRGFGFVEMEGADEAMKALDGQDFQGRPLKVNQAKEREDRRGGGGGGGRGPGGGGGGGRGPRRW